MNGAARFGMRLLILAAIAIVAFAVAFALGSTGTAEARTVEPEAGALELEQRRDEPQTTVKAVSSSVMCPSCDTTLDQSNSPAAERMRAYVVAAVAAGWTRDEIRDGLVDQYDGDESILAAPRATGLGLVAWIVPGMIAFAALLMGAASIRRWRSHSRRSRAAEGQARSAVSS